MLLSNSQNSCGSNTLFFSELSIIYRNQTLIHKDLRMLIEDKIGTSLNIEKAPMKEQRSLLMPLLHLYPADS
ncbi:hypothetical protein [Nostoc commune]|uniref:hypothetical protein n=1 Tax=Nostoc commune TaxID=1178 RepID=UPI001C626EB4|nr:hypothetical protein [Nostoc commune]